MSFFYWRGVVDSGTWLKKHQVFISMGIQNGWAFNLPSTMTMTNVYLLSDYFYIKTVAWTSYCPT